MSKIIIKKTIPNMHIRYINYVILFIFIQTLILCNSEVFAVLNVVTTTTDLKYIVETIGQDKVLVTSIMRGHEDPHYVEPKPSFITNLAKANLLFLIGLELEIWLKPLLDSSRNITIKPGNKGYVDCSQVILVKEIPTVRVDPSMGDIHPYGNPHYWLDPDNVVKIAELICSKLCENDLSNQQFYQDNFKKFSKQIEEKIIDWQERTNKIKNKKIVCYHNSWRYFADAFGFEIIGYVEPKPGIPPTARDIADIIKRIKDTSAKIIIRENYHSDNYCELVAKKSGAKVVILPASIEAYPNIKTYFDLIETIITKIENELN